MDILTHMKVIVKEQTISEKELNLEYPIYLSFQDELGYYTHIKVFPEYEISIEWDYFNVKIERKNFTSYTEHQVLNNLTTGEYFDDCFEEALQHIVKLKSGLCG